jgi:hypothetical protein
MLEAGTGFRTYGRGGERSVHIYMAEHAVRRILRRLREGKARSRAPFLVTVARLCGDGERLDVPQLGQEGVLVVVAAARYHPPFFVEVHDFTEG